MSGLVVDTTARDFQNEFLFITRSLEGWKDLTFEDLTFERFTFGMSRSTYKVTSRVQSVSPNPIILRAFQSVPRAHEINEIESFKRMSDAGIAPRQLAVDPARCYRIEQYLPSRVMKCHEINQPNFRRKLAIRIGSIHGLSIPDEVPRTPYIPHSIDQWVEIARKNSNPSIYDDPTDVSTVKKVAYLFSDEELDFVRRIISPYPLVWSHNDVWTGNILIVDSSHEVFLIDYEVTHFNFPGYDIGKLMLEVLYERDAKMPTYNFKSMDNLPSRDDIIDFLQIYLITFHGHVIKDVSDNSEIERLWNMIADKVSDSYIIELVDQVEVGIMISGFYSALLGMWVGKNPNIPFDFLKFALDGLSAYEFIKNKRF